MASNYHCLHVLPLYIMWVHLWLLVDSSLVNITDLTLSRLIYFTLTTSKFLSCTCGLFTCRLSSWPMSCIIFLLCQSCCCHCIDLFTALKWFCFLQLPHFLPYAGHCLGVPHTAVFVIVLPLVYLGCIVVDLFLCISFNNVKVFHIFYLIKY